MSCVFCGSPGQKIGELIVCRKCALVVARILEAGLGGAPLEKILEALSEEPVRVCNCCGQAKDLLPQGICRGCLDLIVKAGVYK